MAKVCEVCGRGRRFGNRISHAHNVTKRRWNLNLQNVHALVQAPPSTFGCAHPASAAARFKRRRKVEKSAAA